MNSDVPLSQVRQPVLCIGEALVVVLAKDGIAQGRSCQLQIAGAESNVAIHLAALGTRAAWYSLVGSDPASEAVRTLLRERGVRDIARTVPGQQTGLLLRLGVRSEQRTFYYRTGSAAAGLSPECVRDIDWSSFGHAHMSGITAMLSSGAQEFLVAAMQKAADARLSVSFDVNYRPALTKKETPEDVLRLARSATIVFVGRDEAQALWDAATNEEICQLMAPCATVVIKDADREAIAIHGRRLWSRAPQATGIEDVTGAGDAFAAGFLNAYLAGAEPGTCLEQGHRTASRVIASDNDIPDLVESAQWIRGGER